MNRALIVMLSAAAAWLGSWLIGALLRLAARGRKDRLPYRLYQACFRPLAAVLFISVMLLVLPEAQLRGLPQSGIQHALVVALIGSLAWLAVKVLFVAEDAAFRRLPVDVRDNRRMRRARTQIGLMRRLTVVIITALAVSLALVTFAPLRAIGASLLASAGVLGVLSGLAAQTTLSHVFAGLQLAFTDALRLDDVVVVQGEWGRIEEIRLTHVVVRLWDGRRLVLPTTYFTTTPFQNWTRHEASVLGSVVLYLDYSAPVEELRRQTHRIVEDSPLWDRREWVLQVIDTTESTMVVRVLLSAADAPSAWDLRCEVREGLIDFLQRYHPYGLPRRRVQLPHLDECEVESTR